MFKVAVDFLPVVLFFAAYQGWGLDIAVITLMVASPVLVLVYKLTGNQPTRLHYGTAVLVLVLGGLTLAVDNPLFIMVKPTLVYSALAIAIVVSLLLKRNPIAAVLNPHLPNVPAATWTRAAWQWAVFFVGLGILNLATVFTLSESAWVSFKTFVFPVLIVLFTVLQVILLSRRYGTASTTS